MKKDKLLLLSALLLAGCSKDVDFSSLEIVCPTGAPAVAFYNYATNSSFETNSTPSNIVAMMNNNGKDVVVIDTVNGIKAIQNGAKYKIAASITFGNFYLVSTGNDDNSIMDADDSIVLFGQNATPDFLFNYLYGTANYSHIEYVTNVQDAARCLLTGKNSVTTSSVDYVFIAQPALYSVLNNQNGATYGKASIYKNIQEEYKIKSNGLDMIQASVFVKDSEDKKYTTIVNSFLKSLNSDINAAIKTPSLIKDGFATISTEEATALYGIGGAVATTVLENDNGIGLGYKKASEIKDSIDQYISLFNVNETTEEMYF